MNTFAFLSYLRSLEIKLSTDGDRLRLSAPKGALTPTLQAEIAERKAEILTFLHNANLAKDSMLSAIQPVPRDGNLPLSSAQQRLWFLDQLEPGSSAYNIPLAYRLKGQLDVTALERSVREIVRRHEVLRTTFAAVNGQPIQVISPETDITLPIVNLQELPEIERETEAQRLVCEEAQQLFDLGKGPLLRVKLLRLVEEEHILLVTMHHIVSDGWSFKVFFHALSVLYEVFSTGKSLSLPELPIQYADFAHWQQQWLHSEDFKSQLDYWKQQLRNSPPLLELPIDRPRPPVQTFSGKKQSLVLSSDLTEALKTLSQREGVTLFMTLLAAFQTLLYRYTKQEDICVGSPIAGRNQLETERLIGFFINTLVLRTDLSGNPSFLELLGRVREVALGAYVHQSVPFEKLVEVLQPERHLSYNPMFQVMFALQETRMPALKFSGLTLSYLEVEHKTAKFDLTLSLAETSEGIQGYWNYNTDLFDAATIAGMQGHFQTLLEGIVANPHQRLGDLPLLTAAERHQLLMEWNNTQIDYAKDVCIHQLFEAQVERTPEAVAVVFEDQQLTYQELNSRANKLAHHLQTLGVGPEVLVGICLERSLEMIVGLLSILKAGGAYVPIDPAYPKERLVHLLSDSQALVLLTQEYLLAGLPEHRAQVICLDRDWEVISVQSQENPASGVKPENLAYVIYTSGSTGIPKGVTIQHGSVLNLFTGLHQAIYSHYQDSQLRVSVNGSLAFDTSVKQIVQLLQGHTLVIVPEAIRFDGNTLLSYLRHRQVDVFDCTPSQLGLLISAGLLTPLQSTPKCVLVGGEPLNESTWRALAQAEYTNFYNVYGPTECTVDATVCHLQMAGDKPVIGRPIANTQIYILDRHLQPVPIGVGGELHIGGAGLARGYLNRPELTCEKFIPNPFSDEPGTRLYKTGDLVRYLPDGNIEFLGRTDHQVKIRGFRIEIGEIEAVLAQHPAVQETVIIAREDVPGDKRLVAYVVCIQEQSLTTQEMRSFLKEKLPNYMVPSAFVLLEALPLTPNGKVDRRALPAPDWKRRDPEETFVAPRSPVEVALAAIWVQVLGLEQVGIYDNFFELGGHSLLAIRLLSEIEKTFGKNLPLATFFEAQTLEQLASILSQEESTAPWRSLVVIQPGHQSRSPLFLMHEIWGNVFFYRDLVRYLDPEQPCYGLQARGLDSKQAPHTSIIEMAAYYIKEIQTVQPEGPYFIGGFSLGGKIAFEIARQLQAQGEKIALLAIFDTLPPSYFESNSSKIESHHLGRQIFFHLRKLSKLELKDKLSYLWLRLEWHLTGGKLSPFYKSYIRYIKRSPQDLRLLDVLKANSQASNSYVPQVYTGQLTLFRASRRDAGLDDKPDWGWGELALGGVEIHEVPGSHLGATGIMWEPNVRLLAEKLKPCLEKAQVQNRKINSH